MRFGSLFAGIGGIDLGLERAGMECAWQVEIDDYCQKVLAKHWPDVERFRDVRECGRGNLAAVDLIVGGFPCQPHSVAGKRRGAEDDRNLWPEFGRIVAELKPYYVLAENVPGIITTYLDTVLSDLDNLGYTCATFNLPAVAFDAPHRRHRIFIVAISNGARNPERKIRHWQLQDIGGTGEDVAHSSRHGRGWRSNGDEKGDGRTLQTEGSCSGEKQGLLADADEQGLQGRQWTRVEPREQQTALREGSTSYGRSWWSVEPDVGRVAHGIPSRVDRLRGLGNAVVPQVAEWIGLRIMEWEHRDR